MAEVVCCPTCESPVRVHSSDEGTCSYLPVLYSDMGAALSWLSYQYAVLRAAARQTVSAHQIAKERCASSCPTCELQAVLDDLDDLDHQTQQEANRG